MSSNIRIERICQHCGNGFIAKTTVTKHCGDDCAKRAYKAKQKKLKIDSSNEQTKAIKLKPIIELNTKEYLSISETCQLLGISRWTLWRAIKSHELTAAKIGKRTIIKKTDLNKLFKDQQIPAKPATKSTSDLSNYYNLTQVQQKYLISEKALHELIKRNGIMKLKRGIYAYVPKDIIDILLTPKLTQ